MVGLDQRENLVLNIMKIFFARTLIFIFILAFEYIPSFIGLPFLLAIFGFLSFFIISLIPYFLIISTVTAYEIKYQLPVYFVAITSGLIIANGLAITLPLM